MVAEPAGGVPSDKTVAVALSGGGVRAMLYGLGALRAVVAGITATRDLTVLASVSGGSLAAAFAFARLDVADPAVTPDRYDADVLGPGYRTVAARSLMWGTFHAWLILGAVMIVSALVAGFALGASGWAKIVVPVAAGLGWTALAVFYFRRRRETVYAVLLALVAAAAGFGAAAWDIGAWLRLLAIVVVLALAVAVLSLRGAAIERGMRAALFPAAQFPEPPLLQNVKTAATLVLTATDLASGGDLYMTPGGIESGRWGSAPAGKLTLVRATRGSASFPGILPPLRLPSLTFSRNGRPTPNAPRRPALADGGVYDNLGSEWLLSHTPVDAYLIVVNASRNLAPQRSRFNLFAVGEIAALLRMESIQFNATTAPRRRWLTSMFRQAERTGITDQDARNGTIVRIDGNLFTWVESFARAGQTDGRAERARAVLARLKAVSDDPSWWAALAETNAAVPTSLDRLPSAVARGLIRLGYLSAAVQLHVLQGWPAPESVDPRTLFATLLA